MEIINSKEKKWNESYEGANPWGCTHTHTQALLSVEEKKQKNRINKFNRDGKRSIISLCFLLPSFCAAKNYKKLRKMGVLICYE